MSPSALSIGKRGLRSLARRMAARGGIDLIWYSAPAHPIGRRLSLMKSLGVDLVLDVGANRGQYALELRKRGYRGRIVSFEPLSGPYQQLCRLTAADAAWDAMQFAVGDSDAAFPMNIAGNSVSSSLLPMLPLHGKAAPESTYVDTEEVNVRRLDGLAESVIGDARSVFLKVDVQGYEDRVISGASETLARVIGLQIELSLFRLYEDSLTFVEMITLLDHRGFTLVGLEPGFTDSSNGILLQVDGLFARTPIASVREASSESG